MPIFASESSVPFDIFDIVKCRNNVGVLLLTKGLGERTILRSERREIGDPIDSIGKAAIRRFRVVRTGNVRCLDEELGRNCVAG